MVKLGFDFDNTLDRKNIQQYAKELISRGYEVWIVTGRMTNDIYTKHMFSKGIIVPYNINSDLFKVAKEVGIPENRIQFMNMRDKYHFFISHPDFLWHLDDDFIEIKGINKNTSVIGISSISSNWKNKCEKILNIFYDRL